MIVLKFKLNFCHLAIILFLNAMPYAYPSENETTCHWVNKLKDVKEINKQSRIIESLVLKGISEGKNGNFEESIKYFEKAKAISPFNPLPVINMAYALLLSGHLDQAIKTYNKALELSPTNGVFYNSRGYAHYLNNSPQLALKDFNEAIKRDPDIFYFYSNRSKIKKILGDTEGARYDIQQAILKKSKYHE